MPKKAMSAQEQQNRELLEALRVGQAQLGERDSDTVKYMPNCKSTYYQRKNAPEMFTVRDIRILAQRYKFTDYQLCQMFGVEYRGRTTENAPETFNIYDIKRLVQQFKFTDYQLCQLFGVEYRGKTTEQEAI